jgi:hypothetical protein
VSATIITSSRTREFTVQEWQERIRNGQRFQERFAESMKWRQYKDYYRHKFQPGILPVNLMFSVLRSMVPQIYFRNPRVTITARKPGLEAELNARIVQTIDNWILGEIMTKTEMKKMIADAFFCGTSTGFIGYDSVYGMDSKLFDPTGQYSLSQFNKKGFRIEYNSTTNPGMPWFLRARPEDVVYPWGCDSVTNAEWVAFRVFRPLDDLKLDKKYENTGDLQGSLIQGRSTAEGGYMMDSLTGSGYQEGSNDRQWVELWQVHDSRTGKILAMTKDYGEFLRNSEDELQIDGLPAETLTFNPDPDYIYGVPDARIIEPQLLELNEIRTQAMKHRRIDLVKFMYKKGAIAKSELEKFTSEKVMSGVEVNIDSNINESIMSFNSNVSGILQDMVLCSNEARGDIRETVGFSRNAGGEYQGKTHISAAETQRVFQSLNIRLDERRDMIADVLTNVIRKVNQIIFKNWTQDRIAQIVGPDGAKWWLKFNGQQLADEYDHKVSPEEGQVMDTEAKFAMAKEAASSWAELNQGAIAQGAPVPQEIQRLLFRQFESSGLDVDRLLAQSSAMTQQAQQTLNGMGKTQDSAVSPGLLAVAMQPGGR